jgi:hypothetical protein
MRLRSVSILINIDINIESADMMMIKNLNNDMKQIFVQFAKDDEILKEIKNIVTRYYLDLLSDATEDLYNELWSNLTNLLVKFNADNNTNFNFFDNIEFFTMALNSIMNDKISELKIKELLFRYNENEKFCKKVIEGIRESDLRDDDLLELVKNVKKLLTIFVRYKKIEILTHKSAAFQYLLKNYTYKRFLKLDDMMKDNYNVNKRLYVNQKIYEVKISKNRAFYL